MLDKRFMSKGAYIEAYTVRSMKVGYWARTCIMHDYILKGFGTNK